MPRLSKPKISKPTVDTLKNSKYVEGIGRRKTAIARVRIYPSTSKPLKEILQVEEIPHIIPTSNLDFTVNEKSLAKYFPGEKLAQIAIAPFRDLSVFFQATVKVEGGGVAAEAEAIRLGLARALSIQNEKWRPRLKALGFLTRDSRMVERKHPGLRKARRPQQWRKR